MEPVHSVPPAVTPPHSDPPISSQLTAPVPGPALAPAERDNTREPTRSTREAPTSVSSPPVPTKESSHPATTTPPRHKTPPAVPPTKPQCVAPASPSPDAPTKPSPDPPCEPSSTVYATTPSTPATAKRKFASVAKRVIIEERIRRVEEEDALLDDEDEEPEEDLTLQQLEEKAKSGDGRAQFNLGQHYLLLGKERDPELNDLLGVSWLIKAAKQGRRGAARLLGHCWIQKKGVTPENEADVRNLSTESKFEQAVRKAARTMYWKLNPDRKKMVAVSEMLGNVSQVNKGGATSRLAGPTTGQTQKVLASMVSTDSNQMVALDDFVEITKKYAQGIVPPSPQVGGREAGAQSPGPHGDDNKRAELVQATSRKARRGSWGLCRGGMMLDSGQSGAIRRAMDMKSHLMVLQYPLHALVEMKEHLVDWASRAGVQWLSTVIPTQHVNALIFFFIISSLTVELFAFVIPLLVFYLAFISMVICTLRVFQRSKAWDNFSALTSLLTHLEPGLDVEQAETNFGWNNLEQYLYFSLSVFFVIFSFPVADKGWIPCSELSTVAIFFTAVSYMSLSPAAATYARRALLIEAASSLCALTDFLPENRTVLRLLGRTFATVPLGESVELKLSLPCLLYVYLFYLFFSMARKRGFRGTYCFLVPYLVCFMWCEFSVVLLQNSSVVGLIRTCVAYFLLLFALPVLALGLAAMLLIQLVKWLLELELTKVVVTLAVCAVPVALRLWTRFSTSILDVFRSLTHRGPVKLILLAISAAILFFWMYVAHAEGLKVYNSTLTWEHYGSLCGPPAWSTKGPARTQIFCSHLEGHRVTWTGRFRQARVAETENGAQSLINVLPVAMADWLRCLYGEAYPKCEPRSDTAADTADTADTAPPAEAPPLLLLRKQEEEELCQIKAVAKHACHVKRFDSYRFEVMVGMVREGGDAVDDPARDIVLMASHEFRQVLLNLNPGNMVEFSTKLEGRLGARAPAFELKAIRCLDCLSSLLTGGRQVKIERNWRRNTLQAMKFAFDFFFSPLLSARIHG